MGTLAPKQTRFWPLRPFQVQCLTAAGAAGRFAWVWVSEAVAPGDEVADGLCSPRKSLGVAAV